MNDFDKLATRYDKTSEKPDKRFSILPTIIKAISPLEGKIVSDLGCGSGFFTEEIAKKGAKKVYGLDSSKVQIKRSIQKSRTYARYIELDIFRENIPKSDIVIAPFVLNYAKSYDELEKLFKNIISSLTNGGMFVGLLDLPDNETNKKVISKRKAWGAIKNLKDEEIKINLYNNRKLLCSLKAHFFPKSQIEEITKSTGFDNIEWFSPTISLTGRKIYGNYFWQDYESLCELGYFKARKSK